MSRGLGKTERWILIHTYLKIKHNKLSKDWLQFKDEGLKGQLFRSEVMLNYFQLERSTHLLFNGYWSEKILKYPKGFKTTKKSKSVYVSYNRTIKSLRTKGYIETWYNLRDGTSEKTEYCHSYITLTKAGKVKAKELLKVNSL